jgi:pimeloyl-ACP methyl ester carboxylesterase
MRARLQALILLAIVLDLPALRGVVRRVTGRPQIESTSWGDVPVELVRPAGRGPWPAWVFINGAHPERRQEPVVTRLSRGLARAGYLVVVPDLPGLGEGRISLRTLEATVAVTEAAAELPEVRGGRVAVIGASTGAGLALLAAARPGLADRITVVAAVAPFANLDKLVCLATTRCYGHEGESGRYEVADLHRQVVAGSLVALLPDGLDRERLVAELDRREAEGLDPLQLSLDLAGLSAEAQAVVGLLRNEDPARFPELYLSLPGSIRDVLEQMSPLSACSGVRAPVEIVVPPTDLYFPLEEALELERALPQARLTITPALDHTRPRASLRRLPELRDFDAFVVRGLTASSS